MANISGLNLTGVDFRWVNLSASDLKGLDLTSSDIRWATLERANLSEVNLTEATLYRANLSGANLSGALLIKTELVNADLSRANLYVADLSGSELFETNLYSANLMEVNFNGAQFRETILADVNLTATKGLDLCYYHGPSTLDHRTLTKSGELPLTFLRGCGLSDWEIEATKLHQLNLTNRQITDIVYRLYDIRSIGLIHFYSCFISYSNRDREFTEILYNELQNEGVRCWYDHKDMQIGDEIRSRIDQSIYIHDRLLLILSENSIRSQWVQKEVETAFEREKEENRIILFPVKLDDTVMNINFGWAADIRRQRHIGDFTHWRNSDMYQESFARLLRDLKADDTKIDT